MYTHTAASVFKVQVALKFWVKEEFERLFLNKEDAPVAIKWLAVGSADSVVVWLCFSSPLEDGEDSERGFSTAGHESVQIYQHGGGS